MTEQTEVLRYIVGPVCTNCYLLVNHKTGELLVVDPGDQAQLIEKQIEKTGAKPVAILLTHGHFDHAGAAEELAAEIRCFRNLWEEPISQEEVHRI